MRRLVTALAGLLAISALICLVAIHVSAKPNKLKPEIFDVTKFGATGDCTTADSPGIQAAIDAAYVAGGGKVYLPPRMLSARRSSRRQGAVAHHLRQQHHLCR